MRAALIFLLVFIFGMIVFMFAGFITVVSLVALVGNEKAHVPPGNNWQTWVVCGVPATVTILLVYPFSVALRRMLDVAGGDKGGDGK